LAALHIRRQATIASLGARAARFSEPGPKQDPAAAALAPARSAAAVRRQVIARPRN
jgi:hypothetical protein